MYDVRSYEILYGQALMLLAFSLQTEVRTFDIGRESPPSKIQSTICSAQVAYYGIGDEVKQKCQWNRLDIVKDGHAKMCSAATVIATDMKIGIGTVFATVFATTLVTAIEAGNDTTYITSDVATDVDIVVVAIGIAICITC